MKKFVIGLFAAVLGLAVSAADRTVSIASTTRDADGCPTSFTLSFGGNGTGEYPLYMMYDVDDRGDTTNGWAHVDALSPIQPNETTRVVQAPAGFGAPYSVIRFCTIPVMPTCTAADYSQDGLEIQWDAIENVGLGEPHHTTTNGWKDITGNGFDWNLQASGWEWTDDGLVLNGSTTVGRMNKSPSSLYYKIRTIEFVYDNARADAGIIFAPGFGRTAYLYTDSAGHVGYYDFKGQAVSRNKTYAYSVVYNGEGNKPTGFNNCWLNGILDADDGMNDYWGGNMEGTIYLGGRGQTPYAKGTLKAVRIYSKQLTDEERAANYIVDAARFGIQDNLVSFTDHVLYTRWLFDTSNNSLTNLVTGWKLTAEVSGRNLTIKGYDGTHAIDSANLDMTGNIMTASGTRYAITALKSNLFQNNKTLCEVTLPETLQTVGGYAFAGCSGLTNIVNFLPDATTSVGTDAFNGCSNLATPLVADAFLNENMNFRGCSKIPSVTLGPRCTTIYKECFYGCSSMTNLCLPDTLGVIQVNAFNGCSALKTISPFLPTNVYSVGSDAFSGCSKIESPLKLGTERAISLAENYTFYNCSKIPSITIGATSRVLPEYCFCNNKSVRYVYLQDIFPPQTALGRKPFNGWGEFQSRWVVPRDSQYWTDFLTNSFVKVWAELGPELQQQYNDTYGDNYECLGTISYQMSRQWLVQPGEGSAFYATLQVQGDASGHGVDQVSPSYDMHNVTDLLPLTCSSPEYEHVGTTLWRCTGYRLEKKIDEGVYELVEEKNEQALTFDPEESGDYRLTWNWAIDGYQVDLSTERCADGVFTVSTNNPATNEGYYRVGETASYTITATGDAPFVRWYGDIGDNNPTSPTITIPINGPKRVVPYFATPWRIVGSTLTDGYWKHNCTVSGKGVKVGSMQAEPLAGILDLTKPIVDHDDYYFQQIESSVFSCHNNGRLSWFNQWGGLVVKLPNTDTFSSLGQAAFRSNSALKSVDPFLPTNVTYIGEDCFSGCSSLVGDLQLLSTNKVTLQTGYMFNSCSKVTSAHLGVGVTSIPTMAFYSSGITNFVMDGAVTSIGQACFRGCSSLKSVAPFLPDTVTYLGEDAFYGCSSLEGDLKLLSTNKVTLPTGYMFKSCSKVTSAHLGVGVTSIPQHMFISSGITNVIMDGAVTSIGASAFSSCSSLKTVTPLLPNTVTSVGDEAFRYDSALEGEIFIGWNKTTVTTFSSNKNFMNAKLTAIWIGPSRMNLRGDTFYGSTTIKDVWIGGEFPSVTSATEWGKYQARIHVPRRVDSVEEYIANHVTPWDQLDPTTVQKKYTDAYPGEPLPIGLSTDGIWPNQWVVRWSSPWLNTSTMLMVR